MQDNVMLSPLQAFFRNKWVRLFLVVDVALLLILILILIWQTTKVSTIKLNVVPFDSTITINGKSGFTNGEYSITPGTYQVTISHDDLETKTLAVDISPKNVVSVTAFLSDTDKTFNFYKLRKNLDSFNSLKEIASSENNLTTDHDTSAEAFIQKFQTNYTDFTTKLPIEYRESTGYGETLSIQKNITLKAAYDCDLTLCIQALVVGTDSKEFVDNLLQDKGINLEDFEIEYKFY